MRRVLPAVHQAPRWLWLMAAVVLVPVLLPLAFLAARVIGSTNAAWDVLVSARTAELIVRSAVLSGAVTITATAIGVTAAWLIVRTDLPARRVLTVLLALPLVIPSYVLALTMLSAAGPRGLAADLTGLSLPAISGFLGAWTALTLSTYPYVLLTVRSALRRLDPSLEEAAAGLGAPPRRIFWTVVLPQLRPAVVAGALLVALYTLSDFGAVSLMRFDVFTRVIYAQYQGRIDRTPAAVLSVVLILLALTVLWAEQRSRGRAVYFTRRPQRSLPRNRLSRGARIGAYSFLTVIVGTGLVLPVAVLTAWLGRGLVDGGQIAMRWGAVTGSAAGATVAALIAMAGAVPIIVLTVQYRSRAAEWLGRSVFLIFGLPHITVALAVVFFGAAYLGPFYQSFAVLVIVYAALFVAQVTGAGGSALLQVDPNLHDAARGLGRTPGQTLRQITLPLISKGLAAGGVLVFLTVMKELPATLLLRPTGFDTLAVRIWSSASDLFYARAAAPALLLVALSAAALSVTVAQVREATP